MAPPLSLSLVCALACTAISSRLCAQDSTSSSAIAKDSAATKVEWISRRDFRTLGVGVLAVGVTSAGDEFVARSVLRSPMQSNSGVHHFANFIQSAGDPGAILLSASLYVVARSTGHAQLADASRHAVHAIALSAAATQLLKLGVGRARPNISNGTNAFAFHPAHGFQTDFNSFPSGHTTAAFAAASAFSREIKRSHPRASRVTTPLLYGVATLVGGARIYNNRHWLSDVVGGALIGDFAGRRVVSHAHTAGS